MVAMDNLLLTMALPRRLMGLRLAGLETPINEHLVKLYGYNFDREQRRHFVGEMRGWLRQAQRFRLKPKNRTASEKFYYENLFEHPFGGVDAENVASIMQTISENYPDVQAIRTAPEVAGLLQDFHRRLAAALHRGEPVAGLLPTE